MNAVREDSHAFAAHDQEDIINDVYFIDAHGEFEVANKFPSGSNGIVEDLRNHVVVIVEKEHH